MNQEQTIRSNLKSISKVQERVKEEDQETYLPMVGKVLEKSGIKSIPDLLANIETILYGVARHGARRRMPDMVRITKQTAKAEGKLI